jgi:spore maturation protein CgeB
LPDVDSIRVLKAVMDLLTKFSARLKRLFLEQPFLRKGWGAIRSRQLLRDYQARREHYDRLARQQHLVYRESTSSAAIRARLEERRYRPTPRKPGEVHTFAFVPDLSWHRELLTDLRELGPLSLFDYVSLGFSWEAFWKADRAGLAQRRAMNDLVLPALRQAHETRPVDWVFVYASGLEIAADTIGRITAELGIPTVNLCLDDKQTWTGPFMGDHHAGQIGIAPAFDLSWTSARVACEWYLVEGGRPVFMPEGFNAAVYQPRQTGQDIPVSFIGGAYGYRPGVVDYLLRHGVPLHTFGSGWAHSDWVENIVEIINRSMINLGMGGIGYSESFTNVKGRDFEIPGTGGGVYLTSFNPDLAQSFVVGEEILCYSNREEMLELIRHYLAHPEEARAIAARGRERCLREHRWLHRYQKVLEILGILSAEPTA